MNTLVLVVCFIAVCSARDLRKDFEGYKLDFNKVYADAEEHETRFQNYAAAVHRIEKKNRESLGGATFAINMFSDMTTEEFRAAYLLPTPIKSDGEHPEFEMLKEDVKAPQSLDWRKSGVVTAVKNQEQCGSCWAFSATETIESAWMLAKKIKNTTFAPLAPQQIVDCDTMDGGCGGGNPPTAYQYVISAGGQDTEASYPYTGVDGTCNFKPANIGAKISNWKYATSSGDEETLKDHVATKGPLSICVDAANWQDYSGGVMGAWQCAWINELDHCVQAVGYDLTASTPYWLVRNSWTTQWGEQGYIRLAYGDNTCGLTQEATYVVI